jgi:adenosine deaminase
MMSDASANDILPPRIDRHVHLEGSVDPNWVRGCVDSVPPSLEAFWRGEPQPFTDFIESFFFITDLLTSADAIRQAVNAIVARLPKTAGGPGGADIWCSPQTLVVDRKLIKLEELWKGIEQGVSDARVKNVQIAVILDAVNHFGPENGHALLDLVANDLPPFVVGFSTGGLERVPFRRWAPVFDRARSFGLCCAAHAGENGPASNIKEAILEAGIDRIVHAVRSAEDPSIMELLAEKEICVDVCVTSNYALVPEIKLHPLKTMMDAGIMCALGTDDPGIIYTDMDTEWKQASKLLNSAVHMERLRQNAISGAWSLRQKIEP